MTTNGVVTATPTWLGTAERPLFGWVHAPSSGQARAAVVLCPPLGIEAICTHFTYRVLAGELAARGLVVVRFDYDGTGDSAGGQDDPGRVAAWQDSVVAAVALARSTGVSAVALVGMRVGALLAAAVASHQEDVDALVLWDPCPSGKGFLREQRAMRLVSVGGADAAGGGIDTLGVHFPPEAVSDLSTLDFASLAGPLARKVLVAEHPERPGSGRLRRRLDNEDCEWVEAAGQSELLDPPRQTPAYATVGRVAAWLDDVLGGSPVVLTLPERAEAVLARTRSGGEVIERAVSIPPAGLFGMVTEPVGPVIGPTIVLIDEGNTPHIGQARMWVDLARAWAMAGLRVLRFDLSGNGDSDARPGRPAHVGRAIEAFDDVVDAAAFVSPADPDDVLLVGFCAGAYQAMEVALDRDVRGICLINPAVAFVPPEHSPGDPRRRACQVSRRWLVAGAKAAVNGVARRWAPAERRDWIDALQSGSWVSALAARAPWVPDGLWRLSHRLLLVNTATTTLQRLVDRGIDTALLCAPADLDLVRFGAGRHFDELVRDPRLELQVLDGLDHVALVDEQRRRLVAATYDAVLARCVPGRFGYDAGRGAVAASSTPRKSIARSVQLGSEDASGLGPGGSGG